MNLDKLIAPIITVIITILSALTINAFRIGKKLQIQEAHESDIESIKNAIRDSNVQIHKLEIDSAKFKEKIASLNDRLDELYLQVVELNRSQNDKFDKMTSILLKIHSSVKRD